jgi:hypothetical protein
MSKYLTALLLSSLGIAILGCGGSADEGSTAEASKPDTLLLTTHELPDGTTTGEPPPELCGPLPILKRNGGQAAISKMFGVDRARVVEAVGVFDTPAGAKSAFDGLTDQKRFECIGKAIRMFSSASLVKAFQRQVPGVGDDDAVVRYLTFDDGSEESGGRAPTPSGYSDVIAVRVGYCTASLLIAVESSTPPDVLSKETTETAAGRLSRACRQKR